MSLTERDESVYDWDILLNMNDRQLHLYLPKCRQPIEQVRQFIKGSQAVDFECQSKEEKYSWIEEVLIRFRSLRLKRVEKGIIRQYTQKVTRYSRAQVSRLVEEYKQTGQVRKTEYGRNRFPQKYTQEEIRLPARTDELHGWLSGPATKKVLEREYANISRISVAHLYNLRRSITYRGVIRRYTKTKPAISRIGERAKPDSKGQPGYIRVDTVHPGGYEWSERCLSHQRDRRDRAVGNSSFGREDIGEPSVAGAGKHAGAISLYYPWISL